MMDVRYARRAVRGIRHAPHACVLAHEMPELKDDKLMAKKSGEDLRSVLGSHCGRRQSQREMEALIEAVRRHRARDFAVNPLVIEESASRGRYSGRVVEDFLRGHGYLIEADGHGGNAEMAVGDMRAVRGRRFDAGAGHPVTTGRVI